MTYVEAAYCAVGLCYIAYDTMPTILIAALWPAVIVFMIVIAVVALLDDWHGRP